MIPGQGRSLGREDPLEEATATHFSILAWRIPWIEEPGGLQSMGSQRVVAGPLRLTHTHTHTHTRDWFMFQASSDEKQSQKRYIRSGGQRGQSGLTWLGDPTCQCGK